MFWLGFYLGGAICFLVLCWKDTRENDKCPLAFFAYCCGALIWPLWLIFGRNK